MCNKLPYCNPRIDKCLPPVLAKIRSEGFTTLASCCGHGKYPATVVVKDKNGNVMEYFSRTPLVEKKRNRYYTRDDAGHYYIKEIEKISN